MAVEDGIPLIEEILDDHRDALGADYQAYRNHVYRVANFCLALHDCDAVQRQKLFIAAGFHDLGIWTAGTFDYLAPSVSLAGAYLADRGLEAWRPEVELMIDLHHKLRRFRYQQMPLVDVFRRGDLADFSLGLVKSGVSPGHFRQVRAAFPNAGFHKRLVQLEARWLLRHPWRPLPVLKW